MPASPDTRVPGESGGTRSGSDGDGRTSGAGCAVAQQRPESNGNAMKYQRFLADRQELIVALMHDSSNPARGAAGRYSPSTWHHPDGQDGPPSTRQAANSSRRG